MIKVLGIAASPRKGGNSDQLLDAFLSGSSSAGSRVERIRLCDLNIAACNECNACYKNGVCIIKDDMQWIYSKLMHTDHIVISTPTFFMGPPAQLKALIDRCQALWVKRFVLKKPLGAEDRMRNGFLLATAGLDKKEAFQGTKITLKAFFYVLGFKYKGELLFCGVDKKDGIRNIKGALDKAFKAGAEAIA